MKKAFTLIELLIVIAIIGILASTIVVGIRSKKEKEDTTYTEKYCNTKRFECRDECADDSWIETIDEMDGCLRKCEIKLESCVSKIGNYTTTNK